MTSPFRRGLSDDLLDDLRDGPCATVFRACVKAGLDVRLRANAVNLYFGGRSVARIVGRNRLPHGLGIQPTYVVEDRIGEFAGRRNGNYLVFDVNAGFADAYAAELPALILKAGKHVGHEENVELRLLQRNDGTADMCCFDRQVQVPGTRRTVDIVGLTSKNAPALVAIEVKRYPDNRIQHVAGQLHQYLEILDPDRKGLRDDVAESYRTVCSQLRRLGQAAPDPGRITAGMPVRGLVIVSGYNPRSKLLSRAHRLAAKLERPIYLWEPGSGEGLPACRMHAYVTNYPAPGDPASGGTAALSMEQVVRQANLRCGRSEAIHDMLKNGLAGDIMPSGRFGANAVWWQLCIITANLLAWITDQLGDKWRWVRMKRLRAFWLTLPGRVCRSGRRIVLKLDPGGGALHDAFHRLGANFARGP